MISRAIEIDETMDCTSYSDSYSFDLVMSHRNYEQKFRSMESYQKSQYENNSFLSRVYEVSDEMIGNTSSITEEGQS